MIKIPLKENMKKIIIEGKKYQLDFDKAIKQGLLKENNDKPHSWAEFDKLMFDRHGENCIYNSYCFDDTDTVRCYDSFTTESKATAFNALGKLIQLRDEWLDGWTPKFDGTEATCCICVKDGILDVFIHYSSQHILAFPTAAMAKEFFKTFKGLCNTAKQFL